MEAGDCIVNKSFKEYECQFRNRTKLFNGTYILNENTNYEKLKSEVTMALKETDTLFDKIERADFVVFGSPVYFGSMTGQMKCFFDKTRDARANKKWLGKPMAAVTVGASKYGGQERTLEHIHSCALVSGMTLIGNSTVSGMGHFGVSAQKPANEDTYAINQCKILAERIIETIR